MVVSFCQLSQHFSCGCLAIAQRIKRECEPFTVSSRNSRTLFGKAPDKTIRPDPSRMPVDGTRFGRVFHGCEPAGKQGRCKQCRKNTTYMCKQCDVLLHIKCTDAFHEIL